MRKSAVDRPPAGNDPILNDRLFKDALTNLMLTDLDSYHVMVDYLFHGMQQDEIMQKRKIRSRNTINIRMKKGTELLRQYLKVYSPDIMDIDRIQARAAQLIARRETEEREAKFPRLGAFTR